jgi:hypothetical protein
VKPFTVKKAVAFYHLQEASWSIVMTSSHIVSLLKCGCVTGALWSLSQMAMMVTVNELGLLSGAKLHLAVVLYAGLRTAMVSVPRAMSSTVFVWLFFHTLLGTGFDYTIPLATLVALLSVIGMSLCLLAGAWPYELTNSPLERSTYPAA